MEKQIRITRQLEELLSQTPSNELEICTAYYFPTVSEIKEYLKQGDITTQTDKLLSGDNPLQRRIISPTKQQEFNNIINDCIVVELNSDGTYDKDGITNLILSLVNSVKTPGDTRDFETEIKLKLEGFLKNRINFRIINKQNLKAGIEEALNTKIRHTIGINPHEFNQISNQIPQLATDIESKLKRDKYIIEKIDLESQIEDKIRNAKNQMITDSNYLSSIPIISQDQIIPKEILIQRIINNVMYKSASHPFKIVVDKQKGYIRINGEVLPISLYYEILSTLDNISTCAFRNINLYLTNNDTIFEDEFFRKYILHLDDTHILGIEKTSNFIKSISAKKIFDNAPIQNDPARYNLIKSQLNSGTNLTNLPDSDQRFYSAYENYMKKSEFYNIMGGKIDKVKRITIPQVNPPRIRGCTNIIYGQGLQNLNPIFKVYNNLYRLSDDIPTDRKQIETQTERVNIIQTQLSELMLDQREDKILERLIYFLIKDSNNPKEIIDNITPEIISEIIDNNACILSNEYNKKYKENPNELINKIREINPTSLRSIKHKYDEIFAIQDYLDYKYKIISQAIINRIPESEWENYFSGKHENEKGRLDNSKIGPFGLAQLLIENEINEHQTALINGNNIISPIFNLFKVDDKTYYIINFNFVTDIKRIFIVNDNSEDKEYHVICEMDALNERLVAYFDEVNENGVAHFYSVQNTEDVWMDNFSKSNFGNAINFNNKEYTTILVFADKNEDKRITQHYTAARKNITSASAFIKGLLDNTIDLRTATSLNVSGNYGQDNKSNLSNFFQSLVKGRGTINKLEMNKLSLIGCSNADQMIENMSKETLNQFLGIDNITEEEYVLIKSILKNQNLKTLQNSIETRINNLQRTLNVIRNNVMPGQIIARQSSMKIAGEEKLITNEIDALNQLLVEINLATKINNEILTKKDSNGDGIQLTTSQEIQQYFESNLYDFTINNIQALQYLSFCAQKAGDRNLSNTIMKYSEFIQLIQREKATFKEEYAKSYQKYLTRTGSVMGSAIVPRTISSINEEKSVKEFDAELMNKKQNYISIIMNKIQEDLFPNADINNQRRYLEIADEQISSIVEVPKSMIVKTAFTHQEDALKLQLSKDIERKINTRREIYLQKVRTASSIPNLSKEEKIAHIVKETKDYIEDIKADRESFALDFADVISKYYFDKQANTKKIEYEQHKFDIFDSKFYEHCDILVIVDNLLEILQHQLLLYYNDYVAKGGPHYELEVRELDHATQSGRKKVEFIEEINSKVTLYTFAIQKLYNSLVAYNPTIPNNKKQSIAEIIERKMLLMKKTIETKTDSKIFNAGIVELTRNVSIPTPSPSVIDVDHTDLQLMNIEQNSGPVGPRI